MHLIKQEAGCMDQANYCITDKGNINAIEMNSSGLVCCTWCPMEVTIELWLQIDLGLE